MASLVGLTISHYKILEKLGEGGMGVVYKAHDTELDRDVALKFLPHHVTVNEVEQARFLQEARAAAILNHPNICTVHAIEKADDQQFIVMECVDGKTLREIVPVKKMQDAITYAIQIAEALQEAHAHGIVHRDIKAENIMVNTKNQVKVMDFGLAKLKGSLKLTKTSSTIGTLAYMAPEQIQGEDVDARSDIFSFGIVLYEMLTGHLPFRGEHEAAMVYSIVNEEPEPVQHYLPDAPSELLHIFDRAMEKDPEERYQTVQDMLIDLRRLKKDTARVTRLVPSGAVISPGTSIVPVAESSKSRRRLTWIAMSGVVALAIIAVAVVMLRKPDVRLNPHRSSVALTLPFRNINYPALSGDGKWIVFPAQGEDGTWDLYMMNTVSGSTPRRVSEQRLLDVNDCDISPDLSRIAYTGVGGSPGSYQVRLVASEGGQSSTLTDTGLIPRWTPDGSRIGYMRKGGSSVAPSGSGTLEVWSIRPDGSDRRLELLDTTDASPFMWSYCWSPDGKSIAWVRNYPEGYAEVMLRNLATGRQEQLTHDKATVDEVIWAANNQIIFISNKSGQSNLWMVPAQGGEATQITQGTAPILGARIAADAKKILYMQRDQIRQIWSSAVDGSGPRQVTTDEVNVHFTDFSPDGLSLAAVVGDVDQYKPERSLYVMDRRGKNRRVLVSDAGIGRMLWSPDGRWLAYSHSGRVYLTQPTNPGTPRLLCEGGLTCWLGKEDLSIWRNMKSYQYSLQKGLVGQLSRDSMQVYAQKGINRILYRDYRQGREGWWIGSSDSLSGEPMNAKRVAALDSSFASVSQGYVPLTLSADLQFAVFQKAGEDGIWRGSLSDGQVERIGTVSAPWMIIQSMTQNGKELLWLKIDDRARLSMIEHPFE